MIVVRDGGHEQFVGAGHALQRLAQAHDGPARADEACIEAVLHGAGSSIGAELSRGSARIARTLVQHLTVHDDVLLVVVVTLGDRRDIYEQ